MRIYHILPGSYADFEDQIHFDEYCRIGYGLDTIVGMSFNVFNPDGYSTSRDVTLKRNYTTIYGTTV